MSQATAPAPSFEAVVDRTIAAATEAERADVLAYLDRRIANAAAIEASTAPTDDTREIAGDRRRQLEVIRDEIAQGMHVGAAAVAAKLSQDTLAALAASLDFARDERVSVNSE